MLNVPLKLPMSGFPSSLTSRRHWQADRSGGTESALKSSHRLSKTVRPGPGPRLLGKRWIRLWEAFRDRKFTNEVVTELGRLVNWLCDTSKRCSAVHIPRLSGRDSRRLKETLSSFKDVRAGMRSGFKVESLPTNKNDGAMTHEQQTQLHMWGSLLRMSQGLWLRVCLWGLSRCLPPCFSRQHGSRDWEHHILRQ